MFKQKYVPRPGKSAQHRTYSGRKHGNGRCSNCRIVAGQIRSLPVELRSKIFKSYLGGLNKRSRLRKAKIMTPKPKNKKFRPFYRK